MAETTIIFGTGAEVDPGREYYWKRTAGWTWNGVERWWEVFVVFSNGWNGAGGAYITELWRWNGSTETTRRQPRNLSYPETLDLIAEIQREAA